jgi:hypothetical protein
MFHKFLQVPRDRAGKTFYTKNETECSISVLGVCHLQEKGLFVIRFHSKYLVPACLLLLSLFVSALVVPLFANLDEVSHHRELRNSGKPDHEGGEAGGLAALLFGVANLPVVLSMILKTSARVLPGRMGLSDRILSINLRQKKYLMKLHYWVNPLALGIAIAHFFSSQCRSTAMPELGMGAMFLVSVLGLMMALRLSPPSIRRVVFTLHTNPIATILVFSFLVIGHSVID